jgi:5-hydroxyisourate hydrolase-like protein (transthyretin family)
MSCRAVVLMGLALALSAHSVSGGCVEVTRDSIKTSSSTIHVSALANGKPARAARIEVFAMPDLGHAVSTFSANGAGIVTISHLREGEYLLSGSAGTGLNANLELIVSPSAPRAPATIAMYFGLDREATLLHNELAAAANSPVSQRVASFAGIVQDPSTAPVPNAHIRVWKQGAENVAAVIDTHAGPQGRFSAALPDGMYTVAFEFAGFASQVVVMEVAKGQTTQAIQVVLQVGQC